MRHLFRKLREPVNGLTHFGAAIAAAVGLIVLLIVGHDDVRKLISLLIYGLSLLLMFSASAIYHSIKAKPGTIQVLRKLDHAAIYLLIAGSYTPFCLNLFTGFWKWGLLAIVWSLAIIGIVVKLFTINAPRWVSAGVYVGMSWLSLAAINEMLAVVPVIGMVWLFVGGLIFTLGAIVYATKTMNFVPGVFGFHEVWHIFVILGCACHYVAILISVA